MKVNTCDLSAYKITGELRVVGATSVVISRRERQGGKESQEKGRLG